MEVGYSRPKEIPFLEVFDGMQGTPTKYFHDRGAALDLLYGSRKKLESFPQISLITRNLIKYPSGRYGVIDPNESKGWSFGDVFEALQGGWVFRVVYFREDILRGRAVWIESDVKGHD